MTVRVVRVFNNWNIMHQPPGNLELLLDVNEWEAWQIILRCEHPVKYAQRYQHVARIWVDFSGIRYAAKSGLIDVTAWQKKRNVFLLSSLAIFPPWPWEKFPYFRDLFPYKNKPLLLFTSRIRIDIC